MACPLEFLAVPDDDLQFHPVALLDMQPVEALRFLVAQTGRRRRARLNDQRRPGLGHHLAGRLGIGPVKMARQRQVNAGIVDRLQRILVPAHRFAKLVALANGQFKQGVVGHQDARLAGRYAPEPLANELHLVLVDPAILERQRPGGIDSQYGGFVGFHPGAQILGNIAFITAKRRPKPPDHVIEGNVMIAGNDQQSKPVVPQRAQIIGGIAKLALARALGQVTADDDEIGLFFLQPVDRRRDDIRVICAKMNVRQMCDPGHAGLTVESGTSFIVHPIIHPGVVSS